MAPDYISQGLIRAKLTMLHTSCLCPIRGKRTSWCLRTSCWEHMACFLAWTTAPSIPGSYLSLSKWDLQVTDICFLEILSTETHMHLQICTNTYDHANTYKHICHFSKTEGHMCLCEYSIGKGASKFKASWLHVETSEKPCLLQIFFLHTAFLSHHKLRSFTLTRL